MTALFNRLVWFRIGLVLFLWTGISFSADTDRSGWVEVKWVADGDTIVLKDGRHVRYIGIDAPETAHHQQRGEPMANQARSANRQFVEGWRLRLVFDQEKTDRYGRTLAYVYRSDGLFVNAELVKTGCAHVYYQWPNTSQRAVLLANQRKAMKKGLGIWQYIEKNEIPNKPYRGNRRSKRFHRHDCPKGKTMSSQNQVRLKNQWAAFWAGFSPARGCIAFP
jgi:micrococcal nuclease